MDVVTAPAPDAAPEATEQIVSAASAPEQQSAQTPAAPTIPAPDALDDSAIDKLLADERFRDRLLKHDAVAKQIDHRAKSARETDLQARVQAAIQAERQRWQEDQQEVIAREREQRRTQELQQLIEEDPSHPLAVKLREEIAQRERQQLLEQERQKIVKETMPQVQTLAIRQTVELLNSAVEESEDLTSAEKAALSPQNPQYTNFKAWKDAVIKALAAPEAKRLAKEMAKVEAKAIVEQVRGEEREKSDTPASLPQGGGATDDDFMALYAAGKSNDHARARKILGSL